MTITICASMRFLPEMAKMEEKLKQMGYKVFVPKGLDMVREKGWRVPKTPSGKIRAKIKYDFIREHFRRIEKSETILVLNHDKDGQQNYIGPNAFLEMGFAFWLGKKIFLLNPIPRSYLWEEVKSMQPTILNGDLNKITF